jgi:hypothetical protein
MTGNDASISGLAGLAVNSGTLTLAGGKHLTVPSLVNSGAIYLGAGSTLTVIDALVQTASGSLTVDLVDPFTIGLVQARNASLAGLLNVTTSTGFDPSNPMLFLYGIDVISSASTTGSLTLGAQPTLASGSFVARKEGNVIRLLHNVSDFNGDGGVDGDDVILFFATWDLNDPLGDINGDGGVDGDDIIFFFSLWDNGGR